MVMLLDTQAEATKPHYDGKPSGMKRSRQPFMIVQVKTHWALFVLYPTGRNQPALDPKFLSIHLREQDAEMEVRRLMDGGEPEFFGGDE